MDYILFNAKNLYNSFKSENNGKEKNENEIKKNSKNDSKKETIRVFVITADPKKSGDATYKKIINGKPEYSGIMWDIMEEVKKKPEMSKYNFEYTFSKEGFSNYTETTKWIAEGKYDLGLNSYARTTERDQLVEFSTPILLDADAVYHQVKMTQIDVFKDIAYHISKLILLLIILGIINGMILFIFDKKRNKILERKNSKTQFFLRSLLTGVATFFGEAGFLFENSTPTVKGIILVTLIMSLAMIFLTYMQGEITSDIILMKQGKQLEEDDLSLKPILGHKGYTVTEKLRNMGAKMKVFEGKTNDDLMKMYLKNPDKYNGVGLTYCDGFPLQKSSQIMASIFAIKPKSLVYSFNKKEFGQRLDSCLLQLREEGKLKRICNHYFGNIKNIPVCNL